MSASDNPQFDPQPFDPQPGVSHEPSAPNEPGAPDSFNSSSLGVPPPVIPPAGPPPVENPAWNGWDVLAIVGLSLVTILVSQALILFGAHFLFYRHAPLTDLAQKPLLLLVSQFMIDGAVAVYLFLWIEGKYRVRFWQAIHWNWPKREWRLLALGTLMLLALTMLENLLPMPKDTPFEKLFERPRDAYLVAFIAVTLGPLVEELFFRGFLYPVLARRWGVAWGIFLTALPFAAMHLPQYGYAWGALLVILVVGIVCGVVRAVTKSVGASFLVHVGYNGTQMLLAVLWTRGFTHMPKGLLEY
ncbi:MAG TPA: CPBP family intramembrane glutamic endopeptidase [Candidatus Sulfotelmatobacter sp.]|nr:CPBP family intramembrane glutamic endopeptidase [Candidatus Sulfotelmatobacter sp.]